MRPQLRSLRMYDTLWKLGCSPFQLVQDFFHQPWWHGWFWINQKPYPPGSKHSWMEIRHVQQDLHPSFHDAVPAAIAIEDVQVRNKRLQDLSWTPHKSLSPRLLRHLLPEISTPIVAARLSFKHQKTKTIHISNSVMRKSIAPVQVDDLQKVTIPGRPSVYTGHSERFLHRGIFPTTVLATCRLHPTSTLNWCGYVSKLSKLCAWKPSVVNLKMNHFYNM